MKNIHDNLFNHQCCFCFYPFSISIETLKTMSSSSSSACPNAERCCFHVKAPEVSVPRHFPGHLGPGVTGQNIPPAGVFIHSGHFYNNNNKELLRRGSGYQKGCLACNSCLLGIGCRHPDDPGIYAGKLSLRWSEETQSPISEGNCARK